MILCSHCMLLRDCDHLAARGKICSSKANPKARLKCPSLKFHLAAHRHLPDPLQMIVLLQRVQQARSHNLLPPARIPHGGLVWCFLSAVLLFQRVDNGDAADEQLFLFIQFFCNSNLVSCLPHTLIAHFSMICQNNLLGLSQSAPTGCCQLSLYARLKIS